jgi:hypothetical protein
MPLPTAWNTGHCTTSILVTPWALNLTLETPAIVTVTRSSPHASTPFDLAILRFSIALSLLHR